MRPPLVVIPAWNEARSLPSVIAEVRASAARAIVVVDDASTDDTPRLLAGLGVSSIRLAARSGVGGAVRAGLRYALAHGHEVVIRLDGDGQHGADQIVDLLRVLSDARRVDAVVGSRYMNMARRGSTPWPRRVAQRALSAMLSRLVGEQVTDPTSGFWAFGPRAVRFLAEAHPAGYGEPELHLLLRRAGLGVAEVPVSMRQRIAGRTTLTPLAGGLAFTRSCLAVLGGHLRAARQGGG